MSLDPAKSIIAKLGGIDATASATGIHKSRVYRWMAPKGAFGTGGRIPQRHIPGILRHAKEIGVELTYADFFEVATVDASAPDDCQSDPDVPPASAATALPDDVKSPGVPACEARRLLPEKEAADTPLADQTLAGAHARVARPSLSGDKCRTPVSGIQAAACTSRRPGAEQMTMLDDEESG